MQTWRLLPRDRGTAAVFLAGPLSERGEQTQSDSSVHQAERRALRLFLCHPLLWEVLSVLELADPLLREAMGWLWCLQQRLAVRESA